MGKVVSINISSTRGIEKSQIESVNIIKGWGLAGDGHGGNWERQVSIFPIEALELVPPDKKDEVLNGGYTENITIAEVDLAHFCVGSKIKIGEAIIEILHIGKEEYKEHGRPYIVSREGRFGKVVDGGLVRVGDDARLI
ncbi:MOSC domain-containing protein [Desulforamulus aquiferis]|uniref:MOSC domain-containing protein n=1 Tax=Desulforamulus aquiferis TaxID=1397668 RepID=A0AAW7ZGG1_9FIRM|nr:MOSC domain-containing protein [Desulforamulus aquiferis]MDO7788783.1 MOSC domain-containing protein [Desulforamulus aquiferis]